jgi:superoxide reductase
VKYNLYLMCEERRISMPVRDEIYKCDVCGNVVFVLEGGDGDLVCCGQNMRLLTSDEAKAFSERMGKPGAP